MSRASGIAWLLAAVTACGTGGGLPPRPARNLILVTVDTLRADRLSPYGYREAHTPTLARLAAEGVVFDRAFTHVPLTLPAHASILTGLLPTHHGVRENGTFRLSDGRESLATALHREGFATAAFIGAYPLHSRFGLARGFDLYDDRLPPSRDGSLFYAERRAEEVTRSAVGWLDRLGSDRFFLWVHLFDPHHPYDPPSPYEPTYDGEIAYVDAVLGSLVAELETRDLLESSLLVVTSDHGEGLGEHGEDTHGVFLYDSTMRVPLLMRYPAGLKKGWRTPWLVRSVDLAPTALAALGLPPMPAADGEDLVPALRREAPAPELHAYLESHYAYLNFGWSPLVGIRTERYKLIEAPVSELYDLLADPGEKENRHAAGLEPIPRLRLALDRIAPARKRRLPAAGEIDEESRRLLASLGYVSGGAKPPRGEGALLDPKEGLALQTLMKEAMTAWQAGRREEGTAKLRHLVGKDPGNVRARTLLGSFLRQLGHLDEARSELASALVIDAALGEAHLQLGKVLLQSGELEKAREVLDTARELDPSNPEPHNDLGLVFAGRGDREAARIHFERAASLDGNALEPKQNLANLLVQSGDFASAEALFRNVLAADPGFAPAFTGLGVIALERGEIDDAARYFDRSLAIDPSQPEACLNLATILDSRGQEEEALGFYLRFLAEAPDHYASQKEEVRRRLASLRGM